MKSDAKHKCMDKKMTKRIEQMRVACICVSQQKEIEKDRGNHIRTLTQGHTHTERVRAERNGKKDLIKSKIETEIQFIFLPFARMRTHARAH